MLFHGFNNFCFLFLLAFNESKINYFRFYKTHRGLLQYVQNMEFLIKNEYLLLENFREKEGVKKLYYLEEISKTEFEENFKWK